MTVESLKTVISSSLTEFEPNEWQKIRKSSVSLDELLTATYSRAMNFDCFEHYHFQRMPYPPHGWSESHEAYRSVNGAEKSAAWKKLSEKYSGYIKAKDETKAANDSNKMFLEDMKKHFERIGILSFVRQIEDRLREWL